MMPIRDFLFDDDVKVIVSIMAADQDAVLARARRIVESGADICEWRIDQLAELSCVEQIVPALRDVLGELPLLATVRSRSEGGAADLSAVQLADLAERLCASGLIDLLDVEAQHAGAARARAAAKRHGVPVVASRHLLDRCPGEDEIVALITQLSGADVAVCKLAVNARSALDVAHLLAGCARAKQQLEQPVIAIAMGEMGKVSRAAGHIFGSAATFASLDGAASAPGQLDVHSVRQIIELLN